MADRTLLVPSMEETILRGAESVIDRSIVALNHPGGTLVNDVIYANPSNSSLDLTKLQERVGVYRIAPTSLGLGNSISFSILNRSLLTGFYLTGTISVPAYSQLISNWFFYLINTLQFSISGINNLQYTGVSLRDMYLLENSKARRDYLSSDLMPAYDNTEGTGTVEVEFICPIPLFHNEGMIATKGFVLDANTLSSTMQMTINFNPIYHVFSGLTGHVPLTYPTSFNSLYLKPYMQMDHLTHEFAAHRISPIFRVPFNFVQYYNLVNQPVTSPDDINTLQLQQLPQGELTRIILSASDATKIGNVGSTQLANFDPVPFSYLRLTLNGNDLVLLDTEKQIYNQQLYNSIGDDAAAQYVSTRFSSTGTTGSNIDYTNNLTTIDCFIPAIAGSMYQSEFSVAESFNGQIFQLYYRLAPKGQTDITRLNWNITYLSNAILSIESGEAKLQT